jgi:hypothetical protein
MKLWQVIGLFLIGLMYLYRGQNSLIMPERQEQQADPQFLDESISAFLSKLSFSLLAREKMPSPISTG